MNEPHSRSGGAVSGHLVQSAEVSLNDGDNNATYAPNNRPDDD